MSPDDPRHPWSRLAAAARRVSDDRDDTAPYAFATRVVAQAFAAQASVASLWERFALRAVLVACALALVSVALNFRALTRSTPAAVAVDAALTQPDDAMSVVLEFAD